MRTFIPALIILVICVLVATVAALTDGPSETNNAHKTVQHRHCVALVGGRTYPCDWTNEGSPRYFEGN